MCDAQKGAQMKTQLKIFVQLVKFQDQNFQSRWHSSRMTNNFFEERKYLLKRILKQPGTDKIEMKSKQIRYLSGTPVVTIFPSQRRRSGATIKFIKSENITSRTSHIHYRHANFE